MPPFKITGDVGKPVQHGDGPKKPSPPMIEVLRQSQSRGVTVDEVLKDLGAAPHLRKGVNDNEGLPVPLENRKVDNVSTPGPCRLPVRLR
jgi:hypothetical protein